MNIERGLHALRLKRDNKEGRLFLSAPLFEAIYKTNILFIHLIDGILHVLAGEVFTA